MRFLGFLYMAPFPVPLVCALGATRRRAPARPREFYLSFFQTKKRGKAAIFLLTPVSGPLVLALLNPGGGPSLSLSLSLSFLFLFATITSPVDFVHLKEVEPLFGFEGGKGAGLVGGGSTLK